jgi:hypothetical protein
LPFRPTWLYSSFENEENPVDARLIDLDRISSLLGGADPEAAPVVERIRQSSPEAWDSDPLSGNVSAGQILESLLLGKKPSGSASLSGRALELLIRELGEPLDTSSFDDARMIGWFATEALEGLPCAEMLYGRLPPPLAKGPLLDIGIGYVTSEEAASLLEHWPEPDFDDPEPEIYAAREQIEEWLRCAAEAQKSLVVVWV